MASSHLVAKPSIRARTRKRLAPSKICGPLVFLGRYLFSIYLRIALRFRGFEIKNPEKLIQAIHDFQEERTRLIIAFRHPYGDEPQLMFHILEGLLPRLARRLGMPLKHAPGMRPVHDYAVPLWGDAVIRFILPRMGALPVYHVKLDIGSVRAIRGVMRDGLNPLGIASEGQVSYHAETLPRIEQGTMRMGFWCASDIDKANRPERVKVLPLSVHYRYDERDAGKLLKAIRRVETLCGIEPDSSPATGAAPVALLPHIDRIESRMLDVTETYYAKTYGYKAPSVPMEETPAARHDRWMALQPYALSVAEHALGIDPGDEDAVRRMYRVRQAAWDRVYPETPVENLPLLEAALADRRAGEAWYAMRHMEFVDLMEYHDAAYFRAAETLTFDRLVETVYTLADLANRLMGGNFSDRPNILRKKAIIVPGEAIDLSARLADYRRNPKRTVREMTDELTAKFEDCIEVYHHGEQ